MYKESNMADAKRVLQFFKLFYFCFWLPDMVDLYYFIDVCVWFFLQPEHTNVCFWYIPPSLRGMPDCDERREKLHRV